MTEDPYRNRSTNSDPRPVKARSDGPSIGMILLGFVFIIFVAMGIASLVTNQEIEPQSASTITPAPVTPAPAPTQNP